MYYCDASKTSCAEIIYQILKKAGIEIDRPIALALSAGIITDTARFKFANLETLRTFIEIMTESGMELKEVLQIVESGNHLDISHTTSNTFST